MPELKKAELVDGIVYMASPVRADVHSDPDTLIQGWLFTYALNTPGVKHSTNATVRLGPRNVPQPDATLRLLPEVGGSSYIDEEGYICGPVELAAEIAASSASMDAHEKFTAYQVCGIREYLLWRTEDQAVDWWTLRDGKYRPIVADPRGVLRSEMFPGLWLDVSGLLAANSAQVISRGPVS